MESIKKQRKDLSLKIKKSFNILVLCKDEKQQERVYKKLKKRGVDCKIST